MVSIRYFRSMLRVLLPLIFIIKIKAMLNFKTSFGGISYSSADSSGTTFVFVTKSGLTSINICFFDLAISITTANFYNITNLAVANTSYYYAKVRCSPYNQLNALNNSFLIFTTK